MCSSVRDFPNKTWVDRSYGANLKTVIVNTKEGEGQEGGWGGGGWGGVGWRYYVQIRLIGVEKMMNS